MVIGYRNESGDAININSTLWRCSVYKFKRRYLILIANITLLVALFIQIPSALASASNSKQTGYISYSDVGQGQPLVLIHAFPVDKRLWKPQQEGLASHFRIITLDLWGFGDSGVAQNQIATMDEYADEVKQLLDNLHIKQAIIGGESMGGYISLAFLKHYPERVKGLVLSDTNSISLTQQQKDKYNKTADDMLANGSSAFIQDFLPKAVSNAAPQQIKTYLLTIMNEQTPAGMAAAFRGIADRQNTSKELSGAKFPILIITGDADQVLPPQQSYDMHDLAKDSRLIVITGAGHLSSLEKPEQWNQAVIDMFDPAK